jgi:hypothetical protein
MRACNQSLFDQISHLKKDIEMYSFERNRDEGCHPYLFEEYEGCAKMSAKCKTLRYFPLES